MKKIAKYSPELVELARVYQVAPDLPNPLLLDLANELQRLDDVEYCDLLSQAGDSPLDWSASWETTEPPLPANTPTPSFLPFQGYIEAGAGMNVRGAWNRAVNGQNIHVLIRDTGVFPNHEDLAQIRQVSSGTGPDHGTASAGVIMARNNGFGMLGIAFNVNASAYNNTEAGMNEVIRDARPGDIVTMSLGSASGNVSLPMIHDRLRWDQLGRLSASGVVVVIGAGNGGVNLRNPPFQDFGDNGVLLAGACVPATGRRVWFSNYNLRNFVNSWGLDVASCGYGDLFNAGANRSYTAEYRGTSAATPLVAGVLALIQSYARNTYRTVFFNWQMLHIINQTGAREGVPDMIGSRPNAEAALRFVDSLFL
ncbi:S8 family serine peptidase [Acerihabitans sp. KWT182]|uniref:S8 family serine peptidase n=1 Tax=Acerihabitans sp. KWT182 TaxID=3157919 RepID=A0AAU7QE83_9GAMM